MPVFTRAYANFARAISRATTNGSARPFTRRQSRRSGSCQSGRSSSCESGRSSSGESRRTGTTTDGKRASGGTCRTRRDHYRYLKSCTDRWESCPCGRSGTRGRN